MRQAVQERAEKLAKIDLSNMNLSDLELIATGAMSPLAGFMGQADYERVVDEMRLSNNLLWSIPVTLPVDDETLAELGLEDSPNESSRNGCKTKKSKKKKKRGKK